MRLYFAYGSNLNKGQMKRRCPSSEFAGIARLDGYKLAFTRYSTKRKGGVASIEKSEGDCVWGALYKVADEDIESLDKHEGVPYSYLRNDEIQVASPDGKPVQVFTYLANKTAYFTPHKDYLQQIIRGASQAELPAEYIEELKGVTSEL